MEDYKCQVTLNCNGVMLNIRGQTDEEVSLRVNLWFERMKGYIEQLEKIKVNASYSPAGLENKAKSKDIICQYCSEPMKPVEKKNPRMPDWRCNCGGVYWQKTNYWKKGGPQYGTK